jgi:hypothetical protein
VISDEGKGSRELKLLERMVINWKQSYEKMPNDNKPGWEFLADDLADDIRRDLVPYVLRLKTCSYITETQVAGFFGWCCEQVEELRSELELQVNWVTLARGGFNGHKTGDS